MSRLSFALFAVVALGCGGGAASWGGPSAGAGARAGGAQDIALARSKVASGIVPQPVDLPFEGLYAEHDLPVDGSTCTELFCVAAGTARVDAAAWIQLGMSSNTDLTKFHRAPLNAALVIDNSGSMGTEKMEAVKAAAEKLVDQLNEGDLLTVIRFDDTAQVLIGPLAVSDKDAFKTQIRRLKADGSTCIECGLKFGYDAIARNLDATRSARVFLMTDAQPNVGATGSTEFTTLLETNAEKNVGLSLFGVGLDFGQTLVTRVTAARGANYFFLATEAQMRAVFDQDFDMLVTPVAYDLHLVLQPADQVSLSAVYGIPGTQESTKVESTVATVFLSRTRGALVAKLSDVDAGAAIANASLTFKTPSGESKSQQLAVAAPEQAAPSYSGKGAQKAVALTRYLLAAREACVLHAAGEKAKAIAQIDAAVKLLSDEATAMADPALEKEAVFARALAALIAK